MLEFRERIKGFTHMAQETNTTLREPTEQDLACGTPTSELAIEYQVTAKTVTNWLNTASIPSYRRGKQFVVLADDLARFRLIAESKIKNKAQEVEVIRENTSYIEQGFREENSSYSLMIRESIEEGRDLAMACEQAKWLAFTETRQTLVEMIWGRRNDTARVKPPCLEEVRAQLDRASAYLLGGVT